ncbi:hypothetical protein BT69DRAFT_1343596 [Atractiella rhizophila]|nr:hypothetical protein BT69DRAFT_1343596 [Atractiella rhizophila]
MTARRFEHLLSTLHDILSVPKDENVQELARILSANRGSWIGLGEWEGKKENERKELERGIVVMDSQNLRVNQDFVNEAIFLSNTLDLSEAQACSLLRATAHSAEAAITLFHRERLFCIRCLQEIWRGALMPMEENEEGYEIKRYLEEFARTLEAELVPVKRGQTAKGKWQERLWGEIETLGEWEAQIRKELDLEKRKQAATVVPAATTSSSFGSNFSFLKQTSSPSATTNPQASTSTAPPKSSPQTLSETVQTTRIELVRAEKKELAYLLNLIAFGRQLNKNVMFKMMEWLSKIEKSSEEGVVIPILLTFVIQFDTSNYKKYDAYQDDEQVLPAEWMLNDIGFLSKLNDLARKPWRSPPVRAVFLILWSLYLVYAMLRKAGLEKELNFYGEEIAAMAERAILDGALSFIAIDILAFRKPLDDVSPTNHFTYLGENGKGEPLLDSVAQKDLLVEYLRRLITSFISTMLNTIRKLKNREEDLITGAALSSSQHGGRARVSEPNIRHDTETLFYLIASLYQGEPDAAIEFWNEDDDESAPKTPQRRKSSGRSGGSHPLPYFIRWGVDCRTPAMMSAFYRMLGSLAEGPTCSALAFHFLNGGGGGMEVDASSGGSCSWNELFGALQFYAEQVAVTNPSAQTQTTSSFTTTSQQQTRNVGEIPPVEVELLKSFLKLLTTVVRYSPLARTSLWDNQRYRPATTLFALLVRYIPVDLKASLLDAISAFGGGNWDMAKRIWVMLEASQILPCVTTSSMFPQNSSFLGRGIGNQQQRQMGGVVAELEEVESPNKTYPGTTAFINLLVQLIHQPSKLAFLKRLNEEGAGTIPENLGSGRRQPGIEPYVKFVLEDVFLKTKTREYLQSEERWKVTESCLHFFERCLATYNLEGFLKGSALTGPTTDLTAPGSPLASIVIHPGFDLMLKFLGDPTLLLELFDILSTATRPEIVIPSPLLTLSVLRCMRILARISELQDAFIDVVAPTILPFSAQLPTERINALGAIVPLEQHFLYSAQMVIKIALLVNSSQEPETTLLAVKVLSAISKSPIFTQVDRFRDAGRGVRINRLLGLIDSSDERDRILGGFIECLQGDLALEYVLEDKEDVIEESPYFRSDTASLIRSEILELLLSNTLSYRPGPNFAHLLLGFNLSPAQNEVAIEYTSEVVSSLLDIILEFMESNSSPPHSVGLRTLDKDPHLTEQCYRLLRQLCVHDYSSTATIQYLCSRDNFLLSQIDGTPFRVPASPGKGKGRFISPDRTVETTASAVATALLSEAGLLESLALELNYFMANNQTAQATQLLSALYSQTVEDADGDGDGKAENVQTLPRILEIFFSLDFQWQDLINIPPKSLELLAGLSTDDCVHANTYGCEVYSMRSLYDLLDAARRHLRNSGRLGSQGEEEAFRQEATYLVQAHIVQNHRRVIQFARHRTLRAWKNLLDLSLSKSLGLLPIDGRHGLLLDLMMAILPPLINGALEDDNELLSSASVLLMTRLRDEGMRLSTLEEAQGIHQGDVAIDRLHRILKSIIQAIAVAGPVASVRTNLYTVLLNYLQYSFKIVSSEGREDAAVDELAVGDNFSLDGSVSSFITNKVNQTANALTTGNLSIIQSAFDRLLPIICRDASMGTDITKTLAFTLLDTLTLTVQKGRLESAFISTLAKQGYLNAFCKSFKETEGDIFDVLKSDPESLNAIYVYEAKMSCLLRLATIKDGAEKLIESRIFECLVNCEFLSARPPSDPSGMGEQSVFRSPFFTLV